MSKLTNATGRKKVAIVNPDNDLAAWCKALAEAKGGHMPDVVPPGWRSGIELAKELKISPQTMAQKLHRLVAQGKAEKKVFRVMTGRMAFKVNHFRLK
jgi:hypothetical protein